MGELIAKYRIFRYLVTDVFTSSLDLVLFSVFSVVVRIPEVLSNVLSTLITVCISYLLNRAFVFQADKFSWHTFFSFAGLTLVTGMVLQSAAVAALSALARIVWPEVSSAIVLPGIKVVAMLLGAICNYLGYRFIFIHSNRSVT